MKEEKEKAIIIEQGKPGKARGEWGGGRHLKHARGEDLPATSVTRNWRVNICEREVSK